MILSHFNKYPCFIGYSVLNYTIKGDTLNLYVIKGDTLNCKGKYKL